MNLVEKYITPNMKREGFLYWTLINKLLDFWTELKPGTNFNVITNVGIHIFDYQL